MPGHGGGHNWSRPGRYGALLCFATLTTSRPAAASISAALPLPGNYTLSDLLYAAASAGSIFFALVCGILLIRQRQGQRATAQTNQTGSDRLRHRLDRAESLLDAADQRIIIFDPSEPGPLILGNLSACDDLPADKATFIAFGQWMTADSAGRLDRLTARLRDHGESFATTVQSNGGRFLEATGRVAGPLTYIRFSELTGERAEYAQLVEQHARLKRDAESIGALLEALPNPVWVRNDEGKLSWVNAAYATYVGADSADAATKDGLDLLDTSAQSKLAAQHASDQVVTDYLSVVTDGKRRRFDITDVLTKTGQAGIAIDISELEHAKDVLRRTIDFHARTLDQLATAVAIFGPDRKLRFYNAAYQTLWGLEPAFLESGPEDPAILEELRASRKLEEQADFRSWKADMMDVYRSVDAREFWWHLPDGQTLRVLANPHPQGGVTYVYENVTEKLALESRFNALTRVQGETLDNLSEAVIVFDPDGRLRLWNPAFSDIWKIAGSKLDERPHILEIAEWCGGTSKDPDAWKRLVDAITAMVDQRGPVAGRMERSDRSVIDYTTMPLPDGATLATFTNVTDSVNVERALLDKNDALEQAGELKNAFIQHVSYELRSPLTNIIGFAQLLTDPKIGPLNDKQHEYTGFILSSSSALLTIVNDILDLATVDAGIMELELLEVDISETAAAAVQGLKDRITENDITFTTDIPADVGTIIADEKRVRQVLFNLMSNAIAHSNKGGTVYLEANRDGNQVEISVRDEGDGIPADQLDMVFDRFVSRVSGSGRRGAGLGLSIVKSFVELHGGTVEIKSTVDHGTTIICRLPMEPDLPAFAAAE